MTELFAANQDLVPKIAAAYYFPGSERQDVEQEAMIALWAAATSYDPGQPSTFRSWARFVINRHLITCLKVSKREKHKNLNDSAREISDGEGGHEAIVDRLPHHRQTSDTAEARAEIRELLGRISTDLNPYQRYCLMGITSGLTYDQMGGRKHVDNVLWRARHKLRRPR